MVGFMATGATTGKEAPKTVGVIRKNNATNSVKKFITRILKIIGLFTN